MQLKMSRVKASKTKGRVAATPRKAHAAPLAHAHDDDEVAIECNEKDFAEMNTALDGNEAVINSDPHGGGWLFKLKLSNAAELSELMDAAAYAAIA